MIVAYEKLGMFDLAEDARRVLAENYSDPMVLIDYDEVKKPNFWGKIKALVPKKSNDTE